MNTYGKRFQSIVRGSGCYLYDSAGTEYLDALSGIAVCGLGHCHPVITQAICEQAGTLVHTSNLYNLPVQEEAADNLCRVSGMDKVFFCNSGAEANEAALKIARRYGFQQQIFEPKVITLQGSFHGRTMATLSATGNTKIKQGFSPLLSGFVHTPFDSIDEIALLADDDSIVAVLVEPIQGEGGINIPGDTFLPSLRRLCDQNNWLLMLDEIQSGNGRTGHYFAHQAYNIQPDIMTTAKGMGNGFPVGACLTRGKANNILDPGSHGSTFGGNPIACAVTSAVISVIESEQLCSRAADLGSAFAGAFASALASHSSVIDIRCKGLMIGIELDHDCPDLTLKAAEHKLLINVTAGNVIRLLPPLILNSLEMERVVETVAAIIP